MRFKRQSKIMFSMESVAITDIIMNMFIFFFITFSFLASFNKSKRGPSRCEPAESDLGLSADRAQEPHSESNQRGRPLSQRRANFP